MNRMSELAIDFLKGTLLRKTQIINNMIAIYVAIEVSKGKQLLSDVNFAWFLYVLMVVSKNIIQKEIITRLAQKNQKKL